MGTEFVEATKFLMDRIAKNRLEASIKFGGFGMVTLSSILKGLYARQLAKLTLSPHPLTLLILPENYWIQTSYRLSPLADEIAKAGHVLLQDLSLGRLQGADISLFNSSKYIRNIAATLPIAVISKSSQVEGAALSKLMHVGGLCSLGDLINQGQECRSLCKKVVKAKFYRLLQKLWEGNVLIPEPEGLEQIALIGGGVKVIDKVTSKEFRLALMPPQSRKSC